jgi:[acyl-carrier-protein] S-malonyltransferase
VKTALLFAGQATQYVGMGRHLHDAWPEARAVFEAADDALGERLSRVIFEGPAAELDRTENTQPAVLTVACAAWAVLERRAPPPAVVAGHSLGEYGALVAAGALRFDDAVRLCRRRGQHMQAAVPEGVGAMAAVQRLERAQVEAACAAVPGVVEVAAENAPGLVVISGEKAAVEAVCAALQSEAIITPLPVSAPFHCSLLRPAAERLAVDLAAVEIAPLRVPYVPNVDPRWSDDAAAVRERLIRQVTEPVRWSETIALMLSGGVERFWHLGPGRSNLTHVKRQARRAAMASADEPKELDAMLAEIAR